MEPEATIPVKRLLCSILTKLPIKSEISLLIPDVRNNAPPNLLISPSSELRYAPQEIGGDFKTCIKI
jgi:hypothetical protein